MTIIRIKEIDLPVDLELSDCTARVQWGSREGGTTNYLMAGRNCTKEDPDGLVIHLSKDFPSPQAAVEAIESGFCVLEQSNKREEAFKDGVVVALLGRAK